MLLQVDVKSLITNRITVDYFLVAQMLYEKEFTLLNQYLSLYTKDDQKALFMNMYNKSLINNVQVDDKGSVMIDRLTMHPSFNKILAQGDFFDEFIQAFPVSITRPDGTRDYLRTDTNRSRTMYNKATKNKYFLHLHIMECLKYELAIKKKEGKMEYMKRLPKWLASEEWKVYEQMMKDSTFESLQESGEPSYGTKLE